MNNKPVAYMKVSTFITPDSPNGPAEYDQEIEFMEASELADPAGWTPLYLWPFKPQTSGFELIGYGMLVGGIGTFLCGLMVKCS